MAVILEAIVDVCQIVGIKEFGLAVIVGDDHLGDAILLHQGLFLFIILLLHLYFSTQGVFALQLSQ